MLRPITPEDEAFERRSFDSTVREMFELSGLPPDDVSSLIEFQFNAQRYSYRINFPNAEWSIILVDGEPAGRLIYDASGPVECAIAIEVLPAFRRRGIAFSVMLPKLAAAEAVGHSIRLRVNKDNAPSILLAERLGFVIVDEEELDYHCHWSPPSLGVDPVSF